MKTALLTLQLLLMALVSAGTAPAQGLDKLNRFVQSQAPSAAATAFREARDLIGNGEWAKAEARFNRFIAEFPKDRDVPAALYWLAYAMKQQSKFQEADAAVVRLIEQYPSSQWVTDARAMRVEMAPRLKNTQVIEQGVAELNEEIRLAALQSLFEARPDRGITMATDILKAGSGSSRLMREGAIELLAETESKEAVPVLLEIAQKDSDLRLRRKAVEALGEIHDPSVLEPLKALALQSTDITVAREALEALSEHESAALPFLIEVARTGASVELRMEAIEKLDEFENDPTVVDELMKLMASEKDVRVQRALVEALEDIEVPTAQAALAELARRSSSSEVRRTAIEALAEREDEASAQSLIQLYDAEKDERVREIIIEALGESEQKPALRKLTEIALRDPSMRLRKRALEEIVDSDDPDAYKFLEEVLKKN